MSFFDAYLKFVGADKYPRWTDELDARTYKAAQSEALSIVRNGLKKYKLSKYVTVSPDTEHLINIEYNSNRYRKDHNIPIDDYDSIDDVYYDIKSQLLRDLNDAGYMVVGDDDEYLVSAINADKYNELTKDIVNEAVHIVYNKMKPINILTEAGLIVDRPDFFALSEGSQIQVTDDVLTAMMKFITDKYNSLDFGEIEKSAGDIDRFKYKAMILENVTTLSNIYQSSTDSGAEKYLKVCEAVKRVMSHLSNNRNEYRSQYQAGNGLVQLLYTSLVAACLYSVGVLVSNTIRFVTTETETDCQVLYDEIPGTIKHVHIKNILAASGDLDTYTKLLQSYEQSGTKKVMSESVTLAGVAAAVIGVGFVITMIPRVIIMIREIIYSIYYTRVKISDILSLQVDLINTNIESLEGGRGGKKVIARQKKIVQKLEKWKNLVAVKMDTTNSMVAIQKRRENTTLRVDQNSPIVREPGAFSAGDLML